MKYELPDAPRILLTCELTMRCPDTGAVSDCEPEYLGRYGNVERWRHDCPRGIEDVPVGEDPQDERLSLDQVLAETAERISR